MPMPVAAFARASAIHRIIRVCGAQPFQSRGKTMYQLYYYPGNANLAPHILLEEIGADYKLVLVYRNKIDQNSPACLKLNPAGLSPVLIDGDLVLYEAAAIC